MNRLYLLATMFGLLLPSTQHLQGQERTVSYTYDWSNTTANALLDREGIGGDNNDGWVNIGGVNDGADDIVRNTPMPFFSGNYLSSDRAGFGSRGPDDLYVRPNDESFSYSIPDDVTRIELSILLLGSRQVDTARFGYLTKDRSFGAVVGIFSEGNDGDRLGQWGIRSLSGVTRRNGVGAARLTSEALVYRPVLTIDLTGDEPLADLTVFNLSRGGSEQIYSGVRMDLGSDALSDWDQIYLRSARTSVDDLTIKVTTAVPEPSSFGFAVLAAISSSLFRRRQR